MRNVVAINLPVLLCFLFSCSNPNSGPSATTLKNLEVVKNIRDAISTNQLNKLNDYIAIDAIDHDGDQGYIKGLDSIKMQMREWHSGMEEKMEIIKELADDDYVMSWEHSTGKYLTTGQGHKAGDSFDMKLVGIARLKNGKVTEHWMMMPPSDVMKMMASTTAPAVQSVPEIRSDSVMIKRASK
jgi:SnoaL-like polyketide cyclase